MKKVIISGATSYISRALMRKLIEEDIYIYALCRNKNDLDEFSANKSINIVEIEMKNYHLLNQYICDEEIDVLFSFAWQGVYGDDLKDYKIQLDNAKYTVDLMTVANSMHIKKFILIGSVNELEINTVLNENEKIRYTCNLGATKLATEALCKVIASNTNIQFQAAILPATFGEHNLLNTLPNVVIKALINNTPLKLVNGNFMYDLVYVGDVANGLIAMAKKGKNLSRYYIGHLVIKTLKEFIIDIKNIINPSYELTFGEFPDNNKISYDEISISKLYDDTQFMVDNNFEQQVLKTANWIKKQEGLK